MNNALLVFTGFYLPGYKGGGPIRTIANMVEQMGDEFDFSLYTADRDLGDAEPYNTVQPDAWQRVGKANVFYASPGFGGFFSLWRAVVGFKGGIIHLNSFFSFRFSILPLALCALLTPRVNVIVGPRGEFSEGALNLKSRKKKVFIYLVRAVGLYKNITWHASSEFEVADIRRTMGPGAKVHVAIDIATPKPQVAFNVRLIDEPLRLVFVSRISPKKNLLGAVTALSGVKSKVVFTVYGPIEDTDYWSRCLDAAKSLPDNIGFHYCGALQPAQVPDKLAEYDLFFLPTLGENFGHVIAEALSSGVPVLISDATPWRKLAESNLGWDLPLVDMSKFSECIDACATKSPDEYFRWRQAVRAWALEHVGGEEAIEQNRQLFINLDCK